MSPTVTLFRITVLMMVSVTSNSKKTDGQASHRHDRMTWLTKSVKCWSDSHSHFSVVPVGRRVRHEHEFYWWPGICIWLSYFSYRDICRTCLKSFGGNSQKLEIQKISNTQKDPMILSNLLAQTILLEANEFIPSFNWRICLLVLLRLKCFYTNVLEKVWF